MPPERIKPRSRTVGNYPRLLGGSECDIFVSAVLGDLPGVVFVGIVLVYTQFVREFSRGYDFAQVFPVVKRNEPRVTVEGGNPAGGFEAESSVGRFRGRAGRSVCEIDRQIPLGRDSGRGVSSASGAYESASS